MVNTFPHPSPHTSIAASNPSPHTRRRSSFASHSDHRTPLLTVTRSSHLILHLTLRPQDCTLKLFLWPQDLTCGIRPLDSIFKTFFFFYQKVVLTLTPWSQKSYSNPYFHRRIHSNLTFIRINSPSHFSRTVTLILKLQLRKFIPKMKLWWQILTFTLKHVEIHLKPHTDLKITTIVQGSLRSWISLNVCEFYQVLKVCKYLRICGIS